DDPAANPPLIAMKRSPLGLNPAVVAATAAPRRSRSRWIAALGLLLAIATTSAVYYKHKARDQGFAVVTEKAFVKTITQLVNATGKIQAEVEVKISPEVAGEIIELTVREGSAVGKGDLLVRIKPD